MYSYTYILGCETKLVKSYESPEANHLKWPDLFSLLVLLFSRVNCSTKCVLNVVVDSPLSRIFCLSLQQGHTTVALSLLSAWFVARSGCKLPLLSLRKCFQLCKALPSECIFARKTTHHSHNCFIKHHFLHSLLPDSPAVLMLPCDYYCKLKISWLHLTDIWDKDKCYSVCMHAYCDRQRTCHSLPLSNITGL